MLLKLFGHSNSFNLHLALTSQPWSGYSRSLAKWENLTYTSLSNITKFLWLPNETINEVDVMFCLVDVSLNFYSFLLQSFPFRSWIQSFCFGNQMLPEVSQKFSGPMVPGGWQSPVRLGDGAKTDSVQFSQSSQAFEWQINYRHKRVKYWCIGKYHLS